MLNADENKSTETKFQNNINKANETKSQETKSHVKQSLRYKRDKDREIVKGIFHFHEVPGGQLNFSYKEYKEDQVETYKLTDNMVYSLPLGVARHLNKNGWYPVYEYFKGEDVQNTMRISKKVHRFSFQSLEFVDIEDITGPVNEIQKVEIGIY